jgi:hypothetical protein
MLDVGVQVYRPEAAKHLQQKCAEMRGGPERLSDVKFTVQLSVEAFLVLVIHSTTREAPVERFGIPRLLRS